MINPEETTKKSSLKIFIYLLQFLCGAAVLVLEMTGTRVISPFYGGSLQVWASLISVTMLSLAGGYFLGGFLSDRHPSLALLMGLLFANALYILLLPLISSPVLILTNPLGTGLGTFISSFLLFTVPLMILGMVSPFSLKLSARGLKHLGISAGSLYAVSTLGSFLGALLSGFVLIPHLGIKTILFLCAGVLLLLSLAGVISFRRYLRAGLMLLSVLILAPAVSGIVKNQRSAESSGIIYRADSRYGTIRVVDNLEDGRRYLIVNSAQQGFVRLKDMQTDMAYAQFTTALHSYKPDGNKALLIGLGAGLISTLLDGYGIRTDIVEIDPKIIDVARDFFGFTPSGKVLIEDGRYVINNLENEYDFIILDVFLGGSIPYHLFSLEVFGKLEDSLTEGGILCINIIDFTDRERANASKAVHRTLAEVFPNIHIYSNKDDSELENILFFASSGELRELRYNPDSKYIDNLNRFFLRSMPLLKRNYNFEDGAILKDNYNPLETLIKEQTTIMRNTAHEYFGEELFASL